MKHFTLLIHSQRKIILQIALGLFFIALCVFFIRQEQSEIANIKGALTKANPMWLAFGLLLILFFIVVQGLMYVFSFKTLHLNIGLGTGVILYLKRNLISVFLPAGMLTNMAFFNKDVERKEGLTKAQIYFASTIFSFCSIATGVLLGLPALIWLYFKSNLSNDLIFGFIISLVLIGSLVYMTYSLMQRGRVYRLIEKHFPVELQVINDLKNQSFSRANFWLVVGWSLLIELIGIVHLYIAIKAVGGIPTVEMAVVGYSIAVLILSSSPFLRGMGAIEIALTYALTVFGFETALAISAVFVFRFFEFWGVLIVGLFAFLTKRDNLLIRLTPTFPLFALGVVNILSAVTPTLPDRLHMLSQMLPFEAIHASLWLVLLSGGAMLAISIYLLRGLHNAWVMGVVLSILSLIAHLTKGIDWEDASLAGLVLISLIYQRKQYFIKPDVKLARRSIVSGLVGIISVILFATVGFYFLNPLHFNVDFNLWESFQEAITSFLLIDIDSTPVTRFGREFLVGINILGGISMAYFLFLVLRPLIHKSAVNAEYEIALAKQLITKYGKSNLDYFKTYFDKQFWFSEGNEAFIAYKSTQSYAIVLENPTSADASQTSHIQSFDEFSRKNGLRSAYYRIPESSKFLYAKLGKKLLPIGEEAVVNLETWTLEGKEKAALRNISNKLTKSGYVFKANLPPHKDGFLQQLRAVSDDWLRDTKRTELSFSQGIFLESALKNQVIFTLENTEEKVVGFINQIPDSISEETNFDLMRKTEDAPNGTMDFLYINMFEFMKTQGFKKCDLGMVPLSGIATPKNFQEQMIKLAYEKIRRLSHFKSLRAYKEKFEPEWEMMYVAYSSSIDLVYLPMALEKVMQA